jgi:N-acetylmuramoyl-L-alanine amidase
MCKKIVFFLITFFCFAAVAMAANRNFTLVIDAGHGGGDTGAIGGAGVKEKNLTLKFALAFGRLVEQNCPDVKVIYTRKTDKFVELYRRAEIANQNKADLFISIHINALPKGHTARGFQTYTLGRSRRTGKNTGVLENLEVAKRENAVIFQEKDYQKKYRNLDSPENEILFEFVQDKNMENSIELAKYMQKYVCQATRRQDMGAHQDNLAVLRLTSMPGCLIELGFISTKDEEQYMNTSLATEQYARGIFNAFMAYKKRFSGGITVPYLAEPKTEAKPEPKSEPKPEPKSEPKTDAKQPDVSDTPEKPEVTQPEPAQSQPEEKQSDTKQPEPKSSDAAPIFKVQILTSPKALKAGDSRFKGVKDASSYQEGGLFKYTVGASEDYNEINRLRKDLLAKFPEAFIIAFKDGQRVNVQEAIKEFKNRKTR